MFCVLAGTRPDPPPNDWHPRQGESRTNFLAATSVNHHLIMVMIMVMIMMNDNCYNDKKGAPGEFYKWFFQVLTLKHGHAVRECRALNI